MWSIEQNIGLLCLPNILENTCDKFYLQLNLCSVKWKDFFYNSLDEISINVYDYMQKNIVMI